MILRAATLKNSVLPMSRLAAPIIFIDVLEERAPLTPAASLRDPAYVLRPSYFAIV
jgi:hypothetical protein